MGTTPQTLTYNFSNSELMDLVTYIGATAAHTAALGFDPDCHYWNNGITLTINTQTNPAVPEPGTIILMATGLAALGRRLRRSKA